MRDASGVRGLAEYDTANADDEKLDAGGGVGI